MNVKEFFELTGKVRAAQKTYYKSRLQGDLITSKQLESQLDKALKEGIDPEPTAEIFSTEDYQERMELIENGDGNEAHHD